jgi:hypothetical protein
LQRRIDFNGLDVERSALRSESDVVTGLPLASLAWITTGNVISLCLSVLNVHLLAAPGRGLVRLRFDQRRKRAGPILSGSRLAITATWGRLLLHAEPEMFRRTFATIAALNARAFCLG